MFLKYIKGLKKDALLSEHLPYIIIASCPFNYTDAHICGMQVNTSKIEPKVIIGNNDINLHLSSAFQFISTFSYTTSFNRIATVILLHLLFYLYYGPFRAIVLKV